MTQEQLLLLLKKLEKQTTWGKNQIKDLILYILAGGK
jgi:hypothetical protein